MKVLCTMPGKYGDVLWSLPTARALADAVGEPVDFMVGGGYASILPLLKAQPYIGTVGAPSSWEVQNTAPMTPVEPPSTIMNLVGPADGHQYDLVLHLGYRQWPAQLLPLEILTGATRRMEDRDLANKVVGGFTLQKPWIEPLLDQVHPSFMVVVGFTDEYAELKAGLIHALHNALGADEVLTLVPPGGGRLCTEWLLPSKDLEYHLADWESATRWISASKVFVGCLSSQAVLAAALGKPRVLVEPNPNRHHPIFQHWDTPLVKGNDGKPTFDARAMVVAVREKLEVARG